MVFVSTAFSPFLTLEWQKTSESQILKRYKEILSSSLASHDAGQQVLHQWLVQAKEVR